MSINLSWPASRLHCFKPMRIGKIWLSGTFDLLLHFFETWGIWRSWRLCVQNPSCFVLSSPWETGLAKVSRTRPLANVATRVRNNMMLHFVHFRSTDEEHRETVGREGNDKQNGAISYLSNVSFSTSMSYRRQAIRQELLCPYPSWHVSACICGGILHPPMLL